MADKKITELNLLTYATAAAGDLLIIEDIDGAETKAITAEDLAKYALDNRTIGGTNAGDIVTIDGTQTLTNKTITSPKLNEDVAVTSSATEVNVLDGIDAALTAADLSLLKGLAAAGLTNAELGYVNGVTSAIQTQLNNMSAALPADTTRTWTYGKGFSTKAAETTLTLDWDDNLLTYLSLSSTGYKIDPTSVTAQLWTTDGGYTNICLVTGSENITYTTATVNGQTYLDKLVVSGLTPNTDYALALTFRIMETAGA